MIIEDATLERGAGASTSCAGKVKYLTYDHAAQRTKRGRKTRKRRLHMNALTA